MKELNVIHKKDSIHVSKANGTDVNYYIFDEAEIHVNSIIAEHSRVASAFDEPTL